MRGTKGVTVMRMQYTLLLGGGGGEGEGGG